eukprot:1088565-Rhodomonas_salina.1
MSHHRCVNLSMDRVMTDRCGMGGGREEEPDERVEGFLVEVVGRLVERQQVRPRPHRSCTTPAPHLSATSTTSRFSTHHVSAQHPRCLSSTSTTSHCSKPTTLQLNTQHVSAQHPPSLSSTRSTSTNSTSTVRRTCEDDAALLAAREAFELAGRKVLFDPIVLQMPLDLCASESQSDRTSTL